MIRAVILAAGASSRMRRPKAGLPLSDAADTFLARILRTFRDAGLPDIVVVTGCAADDVRAAGGPQRPPVRFVHNHGWAAGQVTSLHAGLAPRAGDVLEAVMVTLVDVPLVSPDTLRHLLRAWRQTRAPIVRPALGDEHGHPVIFDCALFEALRAASPDVGAKAVVRAHARDILDVPVDDPGAFLDIDTEEEYRSALRRFGQPRLPDKSSRSMV